MKLIKIFLVLSLFFVIQPALAQDDKPQKVYSVIYVRKSFDWYVKQYELWEKELQKDKKNSEAWLNFYTAARMAMLTSPDQDAKDRWKKLSADAIEPIDKYIKGTYEYYLLKEWQGFRAIPSDATADEKLKARNELHEIALKAYKLNPDRWEVYGSLLNTYVEKGDETKAKDIAQKWLTSGNITYSLLALNYNSLASCSENAILFTAGDNDTYPAWILQYSKGFRKDVTVMNIWLIQNNREFRNRLFSQNNIPLLEKNPETKQEIIEHILVNKGDRDIYFVHWFGAGQYDSLAENVYNVGAALIYSENYCNNTSYLVDNFENNYLLDQLKYGIQYEEWPEKAKEANFIYVSGLFQLLQHYAISGYWNKMEAIMKMIKNIAVDTQYEVEILKNLEQYEE